MTEILSGMKVLDLTRVASGPWCTQLLADMGATVIKIERPGTGDDSRGFHPQADVPTGDMSAFFVALNRGKQSVTIDIGTPDGAELVRRLASQCDVLVENYKAGNLARYGLDYEGVRAVNPGIVYCSITGFGQTGPYAPRPAYDSILQASAGLMSLCGEPDGEPQRTALAITDLTSGYCAAVSVLGAVIHKMKTGEGQYIDTAMLDTSVALTAQYASTFLLTGEVAKRAGNRAPNTFPSGVFETADDQIMMVCGNNRQFANLCRLLQRPELADDPRFATNPKRRVNHAALTVELNHELSAKPATEWATELENAGIPCARINNMDEVFSDPQVVHRGIRTEVSQGDGTQLPVVRSPLNFSATPVQHRPLPSLGQHTDAVLAEMLGLGDDALQALRDQGVIAARHAASPVKDQMAR